MTLSIPPDPEQLLVQFLLAQPEAQERLADRIYTRIPREKTFPLARVFRWSGSPDIVPANGPIVTTRAELQVDVWSSKGFAECDDIARILQALIAERSVGNYEAGRIIARDLGPYRPDADQEFTPARPRIRFDVSLWVRALASV